MGALVTLSAADGAARSFIGVGVIGQAQLRPAEVGVIEIEWPSGAQVREGPTIAIGAVRQVLAAVKAEL